MAEEKAKEVLELSVPATFKSLIEALVFAAKEPLTIKQMKDIYEGEGAQSYLRQLDADEVEASIDELNAEYEKAEKPYRIIRIAGGYQFATISMYADWIGRLYKEQGRRKLSQSAIESLAIIAYKQPVTKSDIESIRGVNCDYVLKTLLEKELVTIVGREHAPGRPLLYGTTREFLKHFGLNEITDLPRPREIEEILGESQFETERRMLEAQAGAEKMKEEEPDFKSRLPHIPKKKAELDSTVEIKSKNNQREIRTVERPENEIDERTVAPDDTSLQEHIPAKSAGLSADASAIEMNTVSLAETAGVQPEVPPAGATTILEKQPVEADDFGPPGDLVDERVETQAPDTGVLTNDLKVADTSIQEVEQEPTLNRMTDHHIEEFPQQRAPVPLSSETPANKSKWQTWKERVQGFIRKIFG